LSTIVSVEPSAVPVPPQWRTFLAVLHRDLYVTWSELPIVVSQVLLQPLFLLLVFGKVLGALGYTRGDYEALLFPGLVALTAVITGMMTLAFPLVRDFGWTKEIEDRLLAPISTSLVAVEKVVFATARALAASLIMLPLGAVVLGSIPWRWNNLALFTVVTVLGSLLGAGLGLVLGTLFPPERINIFFSLVFTPLLFTGASQYPWPSLAPLPWFQILTALNPMTYVSEGLRAALVPDVPHVAASTCLVVVMAWLAVLLPVGMWGFRRRAID
jgi:ABC-2 type transport system permease protein